MKPFISERKRSDEEQSEFSTGTAASSLDPVDPDENDVLSGRGDSINRHPGNQHFRKLVEKKKKIYSISHFKREKRLIAASIVSEIRDLDPPGRFLARDPESGLWHEIGDEKAREKTSQALREKLKNVRRGEKGTEANHNTNIQAGNPERHPQQQQHPRPPPGYNSSTAWSYPSYYNYGQPMHPPSQLPPTAIDQQFYSCHSFLPPYHPPHQYSYGFPPHPHPPQPLHTPASSMFPPQPVQGPGPYGAHEYNTTEQAKVAVHEMPCATARGHDSEDHIQDYCGRKHPNSEAHPTASDTEHNAKKASPLLLNPKVSFKRDAGRKLRPILRRKMFVSKQSPDPNSSSPSRRSKQQLDSSEPNSSQQAQQAEQPHSAEHQLQHPKYQQAPPSPSLPSSFFENSGPMIILKAEGIVDSPKMLEKLFRSSSPSMDDSAKQEAASDLRISPIIVASSPTAAATDSEPNKSMIYSNQTQEYPEPLS